MINSNENKAKIDPTTELWKWLPPSEEEEDCDEEDPDTEEGEDESSDTISSAGLVALSPPSVAEDFEVDFEVTVSSPESELVTFELYLQNDSLKEVELVVPSKQ